MKRNVLITPTLRKQFDRTMRQVIADLSICIKLFNQPISVDCLNCQWDAVHGKSSGTHTPFSGTTTVFSGTAWQYSFSARTFNRICPICKGEGRLSRPEEEDIPALVTWNRGSQEFFPAGLDNVLACRIKTDSCYYEKIKDADHFEINEVKMVLFRPPDFHGMGDQDNICVAFLVDANSSFVTKTLSSS